MISASRRRKSAPETRISSVLKKEMAEITIKIKENPLKPFRNGLVKTVLRYSGLKKMSLKHKKISGSIVKAERLASAYPPLMVKSIIGRKIKNAKKYSCGLMIMSGKI